MPVSFLGLPKLQYFDNNGDPLSGGKLYSYSPGTTTNKATYPTIADAKAATNANTNPVILDSRGEADVVLAGQTKLVLTDSNDVTIWTLDNVNGDSDFLDANGDEILVFFEASTPVNHIQISNAASGAAPKLSGVGDDANVSIEIEAKAAGNIILDPGTSGDVVVELASIRLADGEGLKDAGGDEVLTVTGSTTPVNQVNVTNADTATAPSIASAGDDTNVGLLVDTKGTGTLTLGSQDMQVATDADTVDLKTGGSSRADLNDSGLRLGGANARVTTILDEDTMSSDSATSLSTQQSIKAYVDGRGATQAQQEAASASNVYASPATQQFHPSSPKVWVSMTYSGTPTIQQSFNVTSLTDTGTGQVTVVFDTDFSSATYCAIGSSELNAGTDAYYGTRDGDTARAAGSCQMAVTNDTTYSDGAREVYFLFFGDQ